MEVEIEVEVAEAEVEVKVEVKVVFLYGSGHLSKGRLCISLCIGALLFVARPPRVPMALAYILVPSLRLLVLGPWPSSFPQAGRTFTRVSGRMPGVDNLASLHCRALSVGTRRVRPCFVS